MLAAALLFVAKEEITSERELLPVNWLGGQDAHTLMAVGATPANVRPQMPSGPPSALQTSRGTCCWQGDAAGRARWQSPELQCWPQRTAPHPCTYHQKPMLLVKLASCLPQF